MSFGQNHPSQHVPFSLLAGAAYSVVAGVHAAHRARQQRASDAWSEAEFNNVIEIQDARINTLVDLYNESERRNARLDEELTRSRADVARLQLDADED
jgi:hypothetical protein